jgi:glycosyl transferase family 87
MVGVERGNVDLTLFAVVVLAVLVSRRGVRGLIASGALLLLAAVLKLFPVFSTGFLARRGERPRVAVAVAVAAGFAVYLIALHDQIHAVVSAVPQGDIFSYGVRRVSEWISAVAAEGVSARLTSWRAWDVVIVATVAGAGWLIARRRLTPIVAAGGGTGTRDLDLFWAGACTYVFTYAVARNFDYRLVFLLATVPQLVHWARAGSRFAVLTIGALVIVTWLDEWTHPPLLGRPLDWWSRMTAIGPHAQGLPVAVLGQLLLFGALVAWLAVTAPSLRRAA